MRRDGHVESSAADRSEDHRQAQVRIGRFPSEEVIVESRHAGGGEAEHETVEGQVMKPAAGLRVVFRWIGAARATTAQIFEA